MVNMATDTTRPTIYPALRYSDATSAISFLTTAFGLREHQVHKGENGEIVHAELAWPNGMVMLSSAARSRASSTPNGCASTSWSRTPTRITIAGGSRCTIVMPLTDQDYGSREYAALDPEGNVWCFGTYQPSAP